MCVFYFLCDWPQKQSQCLSASVKHSQQLNKGSKKKSLSHLCNSVWLWNTLPHFLPTNLLLLQLWICCSYSPLQVKQRFKSISFTTLQPASCWDSQKLSDHWAQNIFNLPQFDIWYIKPCGLCASTFCPSCPVPVTPHFSTVLKSDPRALV